MPTEETAPLLWQVWRRARQSRGRWEKVPGLGPLAHDAAFRATIAEENKVSFTDWEYALAPVGQVPAERTLDAGGRRGSFYEGYRNKVLRPR